MVNSREDPLPPEVNEYVPARFGDTHHHPSHDRNTKPSVSFVRTAMLLLAMGKRRKRREKVHPTDEDYATVEVCIVM